MINLLIKHPYQIYHRHIKLCKVVTIYLLFKKLVDGKEMLINWEKKKKVRA